MGAKMQVRMLSSHQLSINPILSFLNIVLWKARDGLISRIKHRTNDIMTFIRKIPVLIRVRVLVLL